MTLDRLAWFIGQVARPYVLIAAATSSAIATVAVVLQKLDLIAGAAFVTAAWGGVALIYGAKAAEEFGKRREAAKVEVAAATGSSPTPQAVRVVNEPDDAVPVAPTPEPR